MRLLLIIIFLISAQRIKAQDFFDSLVKAKVVALEQKGVDTIIICGNSSSVCLEGGPESCYLFYRLDSSYYVNRIEYVVYRNHRWSRKIKEVRDMVESSYSVEQLFGLLRQNFAAITDEVVNVQERDTVHIDGKVVWGQLSHGKTRYCCIKVPGVKYESEIVLTNMNHLYAKTYYYWLFNSFINNIIRETVFYIRK